MNRKQRRASAKLGNKPQTSPSIPSAHSSPSTSPDSSAVASAAEIIAIGLRYQQSGRLAEAEACYKRVLSSQPGHPDALHYLGVAAYQSKRYDEAVDLIRQALEKNKQAPTYLANLAVVLVEQEKFEEALSLYDEAIALKPDYAAAYFNRAVALFKVKRFEESVASYDKALLYKPDYLEAFIGQGAALAGLDRHEEALVCYDKALSLNPNYPEIYTKRGALLTKLKQYDEALTCCDKALALKPDYSIAYNDRGVILNKTKKYEDALANFDQAIALQPDFVEALNNRGNTLQHMRLFDESLADYDRALRFKPNNAIVVDNKGKALRELGRHEDALTCCDEALRLDPNFIDAWSNRGLVLANLKRFDEALENYQKAFALDPNHVNTHWNESLLQLLLGNYEAGWAKHEVRWEAPSLNLTKPAFTQPYWLGEEVLEGKRILIYNEQGFGDAIQFCRFIPLLAKQGANVILQVQGALHSLLSNLPGVSHCITKEEKLPDFDYCCSINSLPLAFKTRLETIPNRTPYLFPPAQSTDWEAKLGPRTRPRVGLAWSGNPRPNPNRSIPLQALTPLFELDATFVCLQKGIKPNDEIVLDQRNDILNFGPLLNSFADTAALMTHLDLVISIDTSVAHLAGALGLPVWVMLLHIPDWRWLLDREDSPWYPTARLFRQGEDHKWTGVIERVRDALVDYVEQQALPNSNAGKMKLALA